MLDFLKSNLSWICSISAIIINLILIIISLIKSPKRTSEILVSALNKVPDFIQEAEKLDFNTGESKKLYVIKLTISYIISLTGWSESKVVGVFSPAISSAIENILACPQKKGA